jgi:ectoine hydroxylase-related dioxygenase (phytanoyl-CoA dioxygenase family)
MLALRSPREANWIEAVRRDLREAGAAVVTGVADDDLVSGAMAAMYRVRDRINAEIGAERLAAAGERGVLRLMMCFDPLFFRFLELAPLLAVVDMTVSPTAILHLQNGFILPPASDETERSRYQTSFHQDFGRHLNGYLASINLFIALSPFTAQNGATTIVPGTHQKAEPPAKAELLRRAEPVECPAGSMLVFDSTLWHAAGQNRSGRDRLAINHQFTRSYIKQQLDYPRALAPEHVASLPPRTQQLLGCWTRVPASLDEYYVPPERRLYRGGQG